MRVILIAAAASAALLAAQAAHADDDCEDVGRLSLMLSMVSQNYCGYRLTAHGRGISINITRKMNDLGGMTCWNKGKAAVEKEFAWKLKRSEQLQDSDLYKRVLCEASAGYLSLIDTGAPLVEANR